jgi:hypothetical protein
MIATEATITQNNLPGASRQRASSTSRAPFDQVSKKRLIFSIVPRMWSITPLKNKTATCKNPSPRSHRRTCALPVLQPYESRPLQFRVACALAGRKDQTPAQYVARPRYRDFVMLLPQYDAAPRSENGGVACRLRDLRQGVPQQQARSRSCARSRPEAPPRRTRGKVYEVRCQGSLTVRGKPGRVPGLGEKIAAGGDRRPRDCERIWLRRCLNETENHVRRARNLGISD